MNEYKFDKYRERGSHVHYWVLHKDGYRFCSGCPATKDKKI